MDKIKCITFDEKAQDNIPKNIRDRMNMDRDNAEKKMIYEELNIEHLAHYLPYGLKIKTERNNVREITSLHKKSVMTMDYHRIILFKDIKPILRPLSELEDYFKPLFNTDEEVRDVLDADYLDGRDLDIDNMQVYTFEVFPYDLIRLLAKHHFDFFYLIEKGLAIDINTIS